MVDLFPMKGRKIMDEQKIDRRRHYVLVLDTETANTLTDANGKPDMSSVLVYDCGWCVMDTKGIVYLERSFVNKDIFYDEADLMKSAYYAWKIPRYLKDIEDGSRIIADTYHIRQTMLSDMETYGITEVVAHNARFDLNALNGTQRYLTKSKYRYWFPYGTTIWDTMRCARSVIHKMPTYRQFCEENGFLTARGQLSTTAENLYRFIIRDPKYTEEHTALEDVRIEREILNYCYRQHKAMVKELFTKQANDEDNPPPTEIQKRIMKIV